QADGATSTAISADASTTYCVGIVGYGSATGAVGVRASQSQFDAIPLQIQNDFGYTASFSFPGTANRTLVFPDKSGTVALTSDIKFYDELRLAFPHQVDGTGAVIEPVSTSPTYGHAIFSASAGKAGNFALYRFRVPYDLATSVELGASLAFRLGGADTAKHAYKLSIADLGASGAGDSPTFSNEISLNFTGDGSGAAGDIEFVPTAGTYTSLTGWAASLTPGHLAVVKLARDGSDGTNDTSTQSSSDVELVIMYARQPTLAS
ncbi:MAG TPA: hypothetical protein VHM91_03240, partial [Verrucomicrobiales bacterium]|nr:hypothetical protein [Verrucomicrobiales bacterium]